jgi:hypothetical protein
VHISKRKAVEETQALVERRPVMMDLAEATAVLAGLGVVLFCSGEIISSLLQKL